MVQLVLRGQVLFRAGFSVIAPCFQCSTTQPIIDSSKRLIAKINHHAIKLIGIDRYTPYFLKVTVYLTPRYIYVYVVIYNHMYV